MASATRIDSPEQAWSLALFRIIFYAGLLLHFLPSFVHFDEFYGPERFRQATWSLELSSTLAFLGGAPRWALATCAVVGCISGLLGFRARLAAVMAGLGLYGLCIVSSAATQTLALSYVWFVLWTLAIFGGGNEVFAIDGHLAKLELGQPRSSTQGSSSLARFTRPIIAAHLLLTLFLAGLEKLAQGWPTSNVMGQLLLLPDQTILRAWLVGLPAPWALKLGLVGSVATLVIELGLPALALIPRARALCALLLAGFFAGVLAVLQVPVLFALIYWGGCLLLLPSREASKLRRTMRHGTS